MIAEQDVYKIGVLGKPHGVHGEIGFAFTDDVWDRVESDYLVLSIDGILVPFFLEEYRFRGQQSALLKFQDIYSVEAVRELTGAEVFFPFALTPEDEPEDYTLAYFTGFTVVDEKAGELGVIDRVDDTTQNVLFEVGDVLIPAAEEFIVDIDHANRSITMRLPEGLLE